MRSVSKPPATVIHDAATYRPPGTARCDLPTSTTQPIARPVHSQVIASSAASSVSEIAASDLDVVFQPIVDLSTGAAFAFEALTRCKWPEFKDPMKLFERAQEERCCGSLGRTTESAFLDSFPPLEILDVVPLRILSLLYSPHGRFILSE